MFCGVTFDPSPGVLALIVLNLSKWKSSNRCKLKRGCFENRIPIGIKIFIYFLFFNIYQTPTSSTLANAVTVEGYPADAAEVNDLNTSGTFECKPDVRFRDRAM